MNKKTYYRAKSPRELQKALSSILEALDFGIHSLVKQIKGRSSRVLRQEFSWCRTRLPSLWTNSYFVSTVGGEPLEVIKQYIEQQKNV